MAEIKEKKQTVKAKSPASATGKGIGEMITDRRIPIVLGILLLLWSFVLAMSLTSYLSSYKVDESAIVASGLPNVANDSVDNSVGPLGAEVGAFFFDKLFGYGSFLFVLIFGSLGFNLLLRKKIFRVTKILVYCVLTMVWFSVMATYIQSAFAIDSGLSWGGAFGEFFTGMDGIIMKNLKKYATGALLISTSVIIAVVLFGLTFDFLLRWIESLKNMLSKKTLLEDEMDEEEKRVVPGADISIFEKDRLDDAVAAPIMDEVAPKQENEYVYKVAMEEEEEDDEAEETGLNDIVLSTVASNGVGSPDFEINIPEDSIDSFADDELADTEIDAEEEELMDESEPDSPEDFAEMDPYINARGEYDPTLSLSKYKLPDVNLLEEHGSDKIKIDKVELEKNKNQIIQTLINYKIEISKIMATVGPTVTLYEIVPAPGVRISKIKSLEDDIALSLAALGIRIIAPIPGKGTIGIEVPNVNKEIVSMKSMIASEKFRNSTMDLPICLGKTISNEIYIADLAKMPHLLMAGATGQGKSVGINSILISLLYKKHPSELKFVLVDPKKVELSIYSAIEKHFLAKLPGEEDAIITDTRKVVSTLNALCIEMDQRYDLLKKANVRNLKEYNAKFVARKLNPHKGHKYMPLIVVIVDEFADLIMTAGKEVEMPIARIAQLARAIGIHLILATQRPSVNIITGTIKANFPARISFKVASKIDSRTILDMGGADQLIGRGDMLLSLGSDLIRLQCGFVDTPEVDKIVHAVSVQQGFGEAFLLPEVVDEANPDGGGKGGLSAGDRDEMFEDAARVIVQNQMGSTSLIQRRLKLGYNRAGRLMDQLEDAGIVGPNLGSKAREVLYNNEQELERYLNSMK
jgi:S-DNA-T family DNA segregation ATPase FtsK/SpoIIIE